MLHPQTPSQVANDQVQIKLKEVKLLPRVPKQTLGTLETGCKGGSHLTNEEIDTQPTQVQERGCLQKAFYEKVKKYLPLNHIIN